MTYAASEQSVQDAQPVELYKFSSGAAAAAPIVGETTVTDIDEDFTEYTTGTPFSAGTGVTTAPDTMLPADDVHHDWGAQGPVYNTTGTITVTRQVDGGVGVLDVEYNNGSWQAQYFGGMRGYRVYTGFTVGARYKARAELKASWDFTDPNIQGPAGWGIESIPSGQGIAAPCGPGSIGAYAWVEFSFVAISTSYKINVEYLYGNSNWNTNVDNPRHLRCRAIQFIRVTNPDDVPDPGIPTLYHYTSAELPIVYSGDTYNPANIIRNELKSGQAEKGGSELELTIPRDHTLATVAGGGPPRFPVAVTMYRLHRSDLTAAITPWLGQVVGSRFEGTNCVLRVASARALMDRKTPRYLTQRTCGNQLFDAICRVSRIANTRGPFTVSAIDGRQVTVTGAFTAQLGRRTGWTGGILLAPSGLFGSIEEAVGDVLTLKQRLPGLVVGQSVNLVFGCDKRAETCQDDFDNMNNFGGEYVMPLKNPGTGAGIGGGV